LSKANRQINNLAIKRKIRRKREREREREREKHCFSDKMLDQTVTSLRVSKLKGASLAVKRGRRTKPFRGDESYRERP